MLAEVMFIIQKERLEKLQKLSGFVTESFNIAGLLFYNDKHPGEKPTEDFFNLVNEFGMQDSYISVSIADACRKLGLGHMVPDDIPIQEKLSL